MARFGEVTAVDPFNGRAFGDILTYTHFDRFYKGPRGYERLGLAPPETLDNIANVAPIEAHISHDQWVVDCPSGCKLGDLVFEASMLLWCHDCGNAAFGGAWVPVKLPKQAALIDRILAMRPMASERNWHQPETVEDLIAENEQRGAPVP